MENQTTFANVVVINAKKYTSFLTAFMFGGSALCVLLVTQLNQLYLAYFAIVFFIGGPFIFEKKIRKFFSKNADVCFSEQAFSIKFFYDNSEDVAREDVVMYEQLKSFNAIDSYKDDTSYLKLCFKDGKTVKYNFIGQNTTTNENITAIFFRYVKSFNNTHFENKIILNPSFFASKKGFIGIIILGMLMVAAIIVHLIYSPKTIFVSLFSSILIFIFILLQRRKDLKLSRRLD